MPRNASTMSIALAFTKYFTNAIVADNNIFKLSTLYFSSKDKNSIFIPLSPVGLAYIK